MASTNSTILHNPNDRKGAIRRTNDATQVVALNVPTIDNSVYFVDAVILAIKTSDHSTAGTFWRQGSFLNDDGTLAQIGSTRTVATDNNTLGGASAVAFTVSGENIQVLVTGVASTALTWVVSLTVRQVEPSMEGVGWLDT